MVVKTKQDISKNSWDALKFTNDGYFEYVETLRTDDGADMCMDTGVVLPGMAVL